MCSGISAANWSHSGPMMEDDKAGTRTSGKEDDVEHHFLY